MQNVPCIQRFCAIRVSAESFPSFSFFSVIFIIILKPLFVFQKLDNVKLWTDDKIDHDVKQVQVNPVSILGPNRVLHLVLRHREKTLQMSHSILDLRKCQRSYWHSTFCWKYTENMCLLIDVCLPRRGWASRWVLPVRCCASQVSRDEFVTTHFASRLS